MQQNSLSVVDVIEAERFRHFIVSVTDYAIYTLSPEGVVVTWNAGAQRFKGYHPEEIIGRHFSVFYSDEEQARGRPAQALELARTSGKFEDEGWRVRKDGTRFWANVVLDPIRDGAGVLLGFTKITRDITERRTAAEALERAREVLFQSQKLEAVGKLTGGIAHDFNNLLNVIMNGLDLLRVAPDPAIRVKTLDTMERAAQRGASLIQQLLAFARQQPLVPETHDIGRIIRSFEAVLRRAVPSGMRLQLRLPPDLLPAMIDVTQFEAALLNLVVNARDAMPDGGTVLVEAAAVVLADGAVEQLPAGPYVQVVVRDTGTGMSPETILRAVEPFYTTKGVGKGTGLGLSQVYGLAQQSHGGLRIDSSVGAGTAVELYFPVVDLPPDMLAASHEMAAEKVLLVDDQPDVLETAIGLFSHLGYDVLSANDGQQALETLRSQAGISIVFSDVVMPGMSGIDLAKVVRQEFPAIRVILASGYNQSALTDGGSATGGFDLIAKPYRLSDLIKTLGAAQAG